MVELAPDADGLLRREMLALMALTGVGGGVLSASTEARGTPVQPTSDAVELFARLAGDLSGKVVLGYSAGMVWGFRPQADNLSLADFVKRIYGYKSLVARKVRRSPNGDLAIRQQGWTFYADPISDVITDTLRNPYTGVDVKPYSPPSAPSETAYRPDGSFYTPGKEGVNPLGDGEAAVFAVPFDLRVRSIGANSFVNTAQFIRFKPGNIDWYKLEATLISYACRTADLANRRLTHIPSTWSMNLVAEWQTWMNMHGSPGHILFKGEGAPVSSFDQVPGDVRKALAAKFPGQVERALAW